MLYFSNTFRAQTEEYDYEKDEEDPQSDGEVEIIEQKSESNNSINLEEQTKDIDDEMIMDTSINNNTNKTNEVLEYIKSDGNDYSGIVINVTK